MADERDEKIGHPADEELIGTADDLNDEEDFDEADDLDEEEDEEE